MLLEIKHESRAGSYLIESANLFMMINLNHQLHNKDNLFPSEVPIYLFQIDESNLHHVIANDALYDIGLKHVIEHVPAINIDYHTPRLTDTLIHFNKEQYGNLKTFIEKYGIDELNKRLTIELTSYLSKVVKDTMFIACMKLTLNDEYHHGNGNITTSIFSTLEGNTTIDKDIISISEEDHISGYINHFVGDGGILWKLIKEEKVH